MLGLTTCASPSLKRSWRTPEGTSSFVSVCPVTVGLVSMKIYAIVGQSSEHRDALSKGALSLKKNKGVERDIARMGDGEKQSCRKNPPLP